MSKNINQVKVREKLELRRDPYWKRISKGRYVGFRKMTEGSPGTWLARAYDGSRYVYTTLDDIEQHPEGEQYDAAKVKAEEWFKHIDLGGSTKPCTVRAACEAYIEYLKAEKSERAAKDTEGYFKRLVYGDPDRNIPADPIAKILLSKLKQPHMAAWRARALEHNDDRSSFNRNITPLRAALNKSLDDGNVPTDQAWRTALRPFSDKQLEEQGERRRIGTLNLAERKRLVECAPAEARPFFKALALLPMRPGEVAKLKVRHLIVREKCLNIPVSKTKARIIPLPAEAFAHFRECARGKLPDAWLVSRADGSRWTKERWRDDIKVAVRKAKLPRATVAYTLRHSLITELVVGGLDIFHVAKLAGTSVRMIEKHYGHLQSEHAREALERLAFA